MNILMITPCLALGGAEWAFVRQANALLATGHRVTCYVPYRCDSAPALLVALDARVRLVSLPFMTRFLHRVLYKLSQMFPSADLEQRMHSVALRALHHRHAFDVVNPHLNSGTMIACQAFQHIAVPVVETDHGDYALIMQEDPALHRLRLPFQRLDGMICLTRANQERIAHLPWSDRFRSTIIPNCYPITAQPIQRALPQDEVLTFGMISRGVPDKGWSEAIAAFHRLHSLAIRPLRLLLVGGGAHLLTLERDLPAELRLHVIFAGAQADPRPWIECFEVALLPSCFTAESLPNVIIECLAQGKPVIATDIGGIAEMLENGCGSLVPLDTNTSRASVSALTAAMQRLATDDELRASMSARATAAVSRYDTAACANAYAAFFSAQQPAPQTPPPRWSRPSLLIA